MATPLHTRRVHRLALVVSVAAGCGSAGPAPLAPAGSSADDGVGVLARMSGKVQFDGVGDDDGSGYVERDRYERTADDPLAYAGYGYGGFGYGGFGYGGYGYGGITSLGFGMGGRVAPPSPPYEAMGIGSLATIGGVVQWGASAGVVWPSGCALARTATRGAPVVGAVVYLERVDRGRLAYTQSTAAVVTATDCGLAPAVQVVMPVPAVALLESRLRTAVTVTSSSAGASDEAIVFDPGGRVEVAVDRPGPLRLSAPGIGPAWLFGAAHPYYAVTDRDGRYALDAVPPDRYTLVIWHPPLATAVGAEGPTWSAPVVQRVEVTVRPDAAQVVNATLNP